MVKKLTALMFKNMPPEILAAYSDDALYKAAVSVRKLRLIVDNTK